EQAPDLIEGEAAAAPDRDQCQSLQHRCLEKPSLPAPSDRGDQALLFVEPQCRCRNTGSAGHLGDVQWPGPAVRVVSRHALTLSRLQLARWNHRSPGQPGAHMDTTNRTENAQATLWNGPSGAAWVAAQDVLDGALRPFQDLLAAEVAATSGHRVLDVGCGT